LRRKTKDIADALLPRTALAPRAPTFVAEAIPVIDHGSHRHLTGDEARAATRSCRRFIQSSA
jgi:hypothetical protein